jgi:hypothetical protein
MGRHISKYKFLNQEPTLAKDAPSFQHGRSTKNDREVTKIKPLFQQKNCDPHQASL